MTRCVVILPLRVRLSEIATLGVRRAARLLFPARPQILFPSYTPRERERKPSLPTIANRIFPVVFSQRKDFQIFLVRHKWLELFSTLQITNKLAI